MYPLVLSLHFPSLCNSCASCLNIHSFTIGSLAVVLRVFRVGLTFMCRQGQPSALVAFLGRCYRRRIWGFLGRFWIRTSPAVSMFNPVYPLSVIIQLKACNPWLFSSVSEIVLSGFGYKLIFLMVKINRILASFSVVFHACSNIAGEKLFYLQSTAK